jgi:hypothetical protein
MQLNFTFNKAEITKLNIRKEGGDHDILTIDTSIKGNAPGQILAPILGISKAKAESWWLPDTEEKLPAFHGLGRFQAWTEFDGCIVKIGTQEFKGALVRRFKLRLENGASLSVECQVTLKNIKRQEAGYLCDQVKETIEIRVSGETDLFDEGTEDDKTEPE